MGGNSGLGRWLVPVHQGEVEGLGYLHDAVGGQTPELVSGSDGQNRTLRADVCGEESIACIIL